MAGKDSGKPDPGAHVAGWRPVGKGAPMTEAPGGVLSYTDRAEAALETLSASLTATQQTTALTTALLAVAAAVDVHTAAVETAAAAVCDQLERIEAAIAGGQPAAVSPPPTRGRRWTGGKP
jgi:hypothetical protein